MSPESQTVVGQAYTVREILERFTRGLNPGVMRSGSYDLDADFDDIDETRNPDFDLSDVTRIKNDLEKVIEGETERERRERHNGTALNNVKEEKGEARTKDDVSPKPTERITPSSSDRGPSQGGEK